MPETQPETLDASNSKSQPSTFFTACARHPGFPQSSRPTHRFTNAMSSRSPNPSDYSDISADGRRKCQVAGCHKKHAFTRPDGVRKVYSRYCSDRAFVLVASVGLWLANRSSDTCARTYKEEEGIHCAIPRHPGERYCPERKPIPEPRGLHRWMLTNHRLEVW